MEDQIYVQSYRFERNALAGLAHDARRLAGNARIPLSHRDAMIHLLCSWHTAEVARWFEFLQHKKNIELFGDA